MRIWFRLLIVWCMAVALPVQGVAGTTMTHCGLSHERMGVAMEAAQHRHANQEVGAAHHHDTQAEDDAVHADRADHASASAGKARAAKLCDLAQYKCSSCGSCCAGFALPSAVPHLPEAAAEPAAFDEVMVTIDAFASDGPDRPPRSRLS